MTSFADHRCLNRINHKGNAYQIDALGDTTRIVSAIVKDL